MLSKLVGKGVALGSEYREHRKEVKLHRGSSQQSVEQVTARPSVSPRPSNASPPGQEGAPPAYTEVVDKREDPSLASGRAASSDKTAPLTHHEEASDSDTDSTLSIEDDEADWELDEALDRRESSDMSDSHPARPVNERIQDILATAPPLPSNFDLTPLPCPVILPQRRPRKKERGFIHAYPPLLSDCAGIDQKTFLCFLEHFHRSSQASPIWPIIQVAAGIAGFAPSVIATAVCTVAQFAAGTAQELQARSRTNGFLDQANAAVFKPRGLFAMIVKYQTQEEVARSENSLLRRLGVGAAQVDFRTGEAVARYDKSPNPDGGKAMADRLKNIRLASGTTRGAIELPEAAPLVFPDVDQAVEAEGPETFKDRAKDAKAFLADYLDRKAQMEYAKQDPSSTLAVPEDKRTMKSKYSDPNHPMYHGGLVGLVSGGKLGSARRWSPATGPTAVGRPGLYDSSRMYSQSESPLRDVRYYGKRERRALKTEQKMASGRKVSRKKQRRYEDFLQQRQSMVGGQGGFDNSAGGGQSMVGPATTYAARGRMMPQRRKGGLVKRILQQDVLYLMVVNMPSEEELAEARAAIAAAKNKEARKDSA